MSRPTSVEPLPSESHLKILQLNTRRSSAVLHSLLNDPTTSQFHFLLIQEPYIFPDSVRPITHPSWLPFLPTIPPDCANFSPEDSTVKTLIYANRSLPSTALQPIPAHSNCLTAVSYMLNSHSFLLISSYTPPPSTFA